MFIFLDIDGVLNTDEEQLYAYFLNPRCLYNLGIALDGLPGIEIILISSWRRGFISWGNPNNQLHIKMLEKELESRGLQIAGTINKREPSTMKAIEQFLSVHEGQYIIIDDDESEYNDDEFNYNNLYLVDPNTGLTKKDAFIFLQHIFTIGRGD